MQSVTKSIHKFKTLLAVPCVCGLWFLVPISVVFCPRPYLCCILPSSLSLLYSVLVPISVVFCVCALIPRPYLCCVLSSSLSLLCSVLVPISAVFCPRPYLCCVLSSALSLLCSVLVPISVVFCPRPYLCCVLSSSLSWNKRKGRGKGKVVFIAPNSLLSFIRV